MNCGQVVADHCLGSDGKERGEHVGPASGPERSGGAVRSVCRINCMSRWRMLYEAPESPYMLMGSQAAQIV